MTYIKKPTISNWQRQIIIGTLLGGSTIQKDKKGRNFYLSMRGSSREWIECKAQELKFLMPQNPYHVRNNYYRWHSICSPALSDFRELFYDENGQRKITMHVLDELRNIGFSIWFLDSGDVKDKKITLNTNIFKMEGTKIINDYFNEIRFKSEILDIKGSHRIQLDEKSTKLFIEIIGIHVPKFMYPKLYGLL